MTPEQRAQAACRGQDVNLFFPDKGASTELAKSFCAGCPVKEPCALEGLYHPGIWGGMSERQRKTYRKDIKSWKPPPPPSTKDRLEAELRAESRWVHGRELAERLGLTSNTVGVALHRMAAEGRAEHQAGGYWRAS